jgi:hypothetical protein
MIEHWLPITGYTAARALLSGGGAPWLPRRFVKFCRDGLSGDPADRLGLKLLV